MSEESAQRPQATHNARTRPTGHSNKTGMLLAGAAAVALLLGGGYYAFKNAGPGASTEVADNTATYAAPQTYNETPANEVTPNQAIGTDATTEKAPAAALAPAGQKAASSQTQAKPVRVASAEIPEETIGVSTASASQSDEVVVNGRRPVWRYTPRAERLAEYYPANALERGREGEASLHCIVGKKGALACEQVSESPARAGFGTAALRVSRTLRHAPLRADGREALGTPVNLRVMFRMAEGERRG